MKYVIVFIVVVALTAVMLWWSKEEVSAPTVPTATINGHVLEIEVVRTPEEMAKGLSGRESLAENSGMLFVYEQQTTPAFWMKDMNFPIDIIWIASAGTIVDITENIAPETFPQTFFPRAPVQYVLEVNASWAKSYNVSVGDEIMLNLDQ